jgi:hypothetical protein
MDADAATDALRYVKDDQDIDIKRSRVFENMLVEGEGAVEVTVRKLKNGLSIRRLSRSPIGGCMATRIRPSRPLRRRSTATLPGWMSRRQAPLEGQERGH